MPDHPFGHDIFLSYAHADNQTSPSRRSGWVTKFYKELKRVLDEKSGQPVEVWWDTKLRRNQEFTPAIKEVIANSALFVALTSPSYLRPGGYCSKEVAWFCEQAETDHRAGLKLDFDSRLFNVLLYKIPNTAWLPQFRDFNRHDFYELAGEDSSGRPLSRIHFYNAIDKLADELLTVLKKLADAPPHAAPPAAEPRSIASKHFAVYVANVETYLAPEQAWLLDELRHVGSNADDDAFAIDVRGPATDLAQARELISTSQVSIHLLNRIADPAIQSELELGKHAPYQIIWLEEDVDLQKDDLGPYEKSLCDLEKHVGQTHEYVFMHRESFATEVGNITDAVMRRKRVWDGANAARGLFIDVRFNDLKLELARQLFAFLKKHPEIPLLRSRHPQEPTDTEFDDNVRRAKAVLFFFGTIGEDQLVRKMNTAAKVVIDYETRTPKMGVFVAPPPEPPPKRRERISARTPVAFEWLDNIAGFREETLSELLSLFSQ